jgi:hypothetical protein
MAPRKQLEQSIAHLREELAEGEPLTREDLALLDRTLSDVATLLDEDQEDPSFSDSIYDELQGLAERMEKGRPTLSVVVGRIVDALSQLGI